MLVSIFRGSSRLYASAFATTAAAAAYGTAAASMCEPAPAAAPSKSATPAKTRAPPEKSHPKNLSEMALNLAVKTRTVFLNGPISDASAAAIITQLLYLEQEAPYTPIRLHINSSGGKVQAGYAIHDTMQALTSPVHTVCLGHCESMAAILLAAGAEGHREALPNARIMIHQPVRTSGRANARELSIHAESIEKTRTRLNELVAQRTGRPVSEIEKLMEYDHVCDSSEALALGLIDKIVEHGSLLPGCPPPPPSPPSEPAPSASQQQQQMRMASAAAAAAASPASPAPAA